MVTGCEFGLCARRAALSVQVDDITEPVLVCGWHVEIVASWGRVIETPPVIFYLGDTPGPRNSERAA